MGKRFWLATLVIGTLCAVAVLAGLGARGWFNARQAGLLPGQAAAGARQGQLYDAGEFVTNLADTGVRRFIKVHVQLQVAGEPVSTELSRQAVLVRDCVLGVLRSRTFAQVSGEKGMDELGAEVISRLNEIIGQGGVMAIFFTEFVVQ